jgi:hypothetical protein
MVGFSGAPFYFFSNPGMAAGEALTAQSSILTSASQVTAKIEGPNATQFGPLTLTAWRPVIEFVPPPPSGELPSRTIFVRRRPASKPVNRAESGRQGFVGW